MSSFRHFLRGQLVPPVSDAVAQRLEEHYQLMAEWNQRMNLTAIRNMEEAVVRHYCESVFVARLLPGEAGQVADLGSGPGFPGIPIAVVRPATEVVLIEANGKKCVFLREATRDLGNVQVVEDRFERVERRFDWVVSRGVNWKRGRKILAKTCKHAALLVGAGDADAVVAAVGFVWYDKVPLPWGDKRVALLGRIRSER